MNPEKASLPEPEGVGHHRPLRESADRGAVPVEPVLGEDAVYVLSELRVGRQEGVPVWKPDLAHDVPVASSGRERERPAREHAEEAAVRVEDAEERLEVAGVSAATVNENERAARTSRAWRPDRALDRASCRWHGQSLESGATSAADPSSASSNRCACRDRCPAGRRPRNARPPGLCHDVRGPCRGRGGGAPCGPSRNGPGRRRRCRDRASLRLPAVEWRRSRHRSDARSERFRGKPRESQGLSETA
jgi:hypothetical protein